MKMIWKYLFVFIIANILKQSDCIAQITLDTTITPWDGFGYDFYPIQISSTETKYVALDTATNTFSLYNMDFTPFMLNIAVPEPFYSTDSNYLYQVIYVSRSLFDCDTSNIEYAYATFGTAAKPFYIMRTDGTQLFRLDSAVGPYCFGCLDGSNDIRPIRNTSSGVKLYLHHPPGQTIKIFSLCGTLPEVNMFDFSNINQSFVSIFPNPSSGSLNFQINIPDNMNDYDLVIVDNNAKEVSREKVNSGRNKFAIDVSRFSSGTYYYSLYTKSKVYKSGKFILAK